MAGMGDEKSQSRFLQEKSLTTIMAITVLLLIGYITFAERQRAVRTAAPDEYNPPVHPVSLLGAQLKGNPEAGVAIVIYSDFICSACARFALETLPALDERYVATGRVLLALRHTPVGRFRALAPRAAEAAFCAGEQGQFWGMFDAIFRAQLDREYGRTEATSFDRDVSDFAGALSLDFTLFTKCLQSDRAAERVYADAGSAWVLGVEATPSILVGLRQPENRVQVSRHFRGRPPHEVLFEVIDQLLASSGSS